MSREVDETADYTCDWCGQVMSSATVIYFHHDGVDCQACSEKCMKAIQEEGN